MSNPHSPTSAACADDAQHRLVHAVWLDLARKPQSAAWLERMVQTMGRLGLDRLGLHLSDSIGCALALPRLAGRHRPDDLTREQVRRLVGVAGENGVTLQPEIDTPSHLSCLLRDRHDLWLRGRDGSETDDRLDISAVGALEFVHDVWSEVDEWFGAGPVHLGGDEYLTAPWEQDRWDLDLDLDTTRFPQLLSWAAEGSASNDERRPVSYEDAMARWFNELAAPFLAQGREVWAWNDHVRPTSGPSSADGSTGGGRHRVDSRIVVDCWIRWRDSLPSASDLARDGHRVVNANGDQLYFILSGDGPPATTGRKSPEGVRAWRPRRFMGAAGGAGDHWLDQGLPLWGTQLSVWCDDASAMSAEPMWSALEQWLEAYAEVLHSSNP